MEDINVGDKVVITDKNESLLTIGGIYSISYIRDQQYIIVDHRGTSWFFNRNHLKKLEPILTPNGDKPLKYNNNKPIISLVRPEFQLALGEALTYGFTKYNEKRGDIPNYLKGDGFHYTTIIDSLERHLNAFKSGINIDDESGLDHLILAAVNIMFLHTYENSSKGIDDRIILNKLDKDRGP